MRSLTFACFIAIAAAAGAQSRRLHIVPVFDQDQGSFHVYATPQLGGDLVSGLKMTEFRAWVDGVKTEIPSVRPDLPNGTVLDAAVLLDCREGNDFGRRKLLAEYLLGRSPAFGINCRIYALRDGKTWLLNSPEELNTLLPGMANQAEVLDAIRSISFGQIEGQAKKHLTAVYVISGGLDSSGERSWTTKDVPLYLYNFAAEDPALREISFLSHGASLVKVAPNLGSIADGGLRRGFQHFQGEYVFELKAPKATALSDVTVEALIDGEWVSDSESQSPKSHWVGLVFWMSVFFAAIAAAFGALNQFFNGRLREDRSSTHIKEVG